MRRRHRERTRQRTAPLAFTMVELLIVMVIIGIIVAFILSAAQGGIRRAEERATQALITKLEAGMSDRIDALLGTRADANQAHAYLATSFSSTAGTILNNTRAQIIARFELIKSELPDVFVVQNDTNYPLNFAAVPYPGTSVTGNIYGNYLIPMGVGVYDNPTNGSYGAIPLAGGSPAVTGMFGASYTVSAGLYKSLVAEAVRLGATPPSPLDRGYNGIDDDNSGLIDNLGENGTSVATIITGTLLPKHTHKTARAEMLYALLVEGQGPLGSVFNRDEFTDREVRDTDGDGLPEFVDAWGEPIQFYRWPIGFVDDGQEGLGAYSGIFEARQQNPLDANQSLLDPLWWSGTNNGYDANDSSIYVNPSAVQPLSGSAYLFQTMFTSLVDPNAGVLAANSGRLWDRGSSWPARRAFYSRFLVVSGGPDKTPGVPVFDAQYYDALSSFTPTTVTGPTFSGMNPIAVPAGVAPVAAQNILILRVEGQAAQATYSRVYPVTFTLKDASGNPQAYPGYDPVSTAVREAGNDDITNHNLQGPGGATQ